MTDASLSPTRGPLRRSAVPLHVVVFLAPAVAVYTIFSIYPLVDTILLSFYAGDEAGTASAAGWSNFQRLFGDPNWSAQFWNALGNNLYFFAIHMVVQNGIGLGLAMLLSLPRLTGGNLYRTLIFLPTMLSVVIIGFIWQLMLNPLWGVASGLLSFLGLGAYFRPWLGQESTALLTVALISVWQFVGIPMMLIYAALLNIPDDLLDAATVDGARTRRY